MLTLTIPKQAVNATKVFAVAEQPVDKQRIGSLDLLRGAVMVIMALDHVRDYFHRDAFLYSPTDLTQTSGFLFFTRFVTHYCAPVFIFLAGISAYLHGGKKSKAAVSRYLFTRGLWMVCTELFIISLAQTFNPTYPRYNLQVIWAIGICMIVLSALIHLKRNGLLALAVLCIAGHNLLDVVHVAGNGLPSFLWAVLHEAKEFQVGRFPVLVLYPVLPWIGVMALGFCAGKLYEPAFDAARRRKLLLHGGLAALSLFFCLRGLNVYGDPLPWTAETSEAFSFLSFINVTKYPPSLLYVLITLGPAAIFLSLAERPLNVFAKALIVFGRVPFFYYVAHLYLIHFLALVAAALSGYGWTAMILTTRINSTPALKGYGFSLLTVYAVWLLVVVLLYLLCRWFAAYKKRREAVWWLRFL